MEKIRMNVRYDHGRKICIGYVRDGIVVRQEFASGESWSCDLPLSKEFFTYGGLSFKKIPFYIEN